MQLRFTNSLSSLSQSFALFCTAATAQRVVEVGLIGIPNAGKSELTNHLVGQKVTAVSSKRNTTTSCQLGAYLSGATTQVVLHDLPGVLRPGDVHHKGQLARTSAAWSAAEHCDVITYLVDAALVVNKLFKRGQLEIDSVMLKAMPVFDLAEQLQKEKTKSRANLILALNKIDLIPETERRKLETLETLMQERCSFERTFWLSALKGTGISELRLYYHSSAREKAWILPPGVCTDKSHGELAVELVKEKLYRRLNQELPYRIEAQLLKEDTGTSGEMLFEILVRVPNENVRKIVVGRRGAVIEDYVVSRVRYELESTFQRRVSLHVQVKIR